MIYNIAPPIQQKKIRRLMQNRQSARESRNKKKMYIKSLEDKVFFIISIFEIKSLEEELRACKTELGARQLACTAHEECDIINRALRGLQDRVDRILSAAKEGNVKSIERAIQSLIVRYGTQSIMRREGAAHLLGKITDILLPPYEGYFIMAANSNSGPFIEQGKEIIKNGWENFDIVLSDSDREKFMKLKQRIIEAGKRLREKAQNIAKAKDDFASEAYAYDKLILENVISQISPISMGNVILWIIGVLFHKMKYIRI